MFDKGGRAGATVTLALHSSHVPLSSLHTDGADKFKARGINE
jgi:hypothetical protein